MRLIQRDSSGGFSLTKDLANNLPAYAILSHTWGEDDQEVTFRDLIDGSGQSKAGYQKIQFCGEQANRDGLRYFWVDTCCINKADAIEVQRSINSMFRWYKDAAKCYVYLSDIRIPDDQVEIGSSAAIESAFREARWFTRGWTLQELIAPSSVEFFAADNKRIGDKLSLERFLHERTGISIEALRAYDPIKFSFAERLSWVAQRKTTHEEDMAYSLLGIFGIFLPLIYGEGQENAFRRLREEVEKSVESHEAADQGPRKRPRMSASMPDRTEDLVCLRSLAFPEMNYRRQDTRRAHANTCAWVTRHPSYTAWLGQGSGILWIKGKPGSGKSTLMEFLLRDFEIHTRPEAVQLSFFLHGRGTTLQKSRLGMYRSLLHQLLLKTPASRAEFRNSFQERSGSQGEPGKDWNWHVNELRTFFISAVKLIAATRPINIFVDALDEANDGTDDHNTSHHIVSEFHQLNDIMQNSKLQCTICFSCRHFPIVANNHGRDICVEEENHADIATYVSDELCRRLSTSESGTFYKSNLQDTIIQGTQGVFQWATLAVALVIRYYNDGFSPEEVTQMLKEVPENLGDVYKHILGKVVDVKYHQQTLCLMRWVCFAERPLTIAEIRHAISLPEIEFSGMAPTLAEFKLPPHDSTARRIVSLSGGLVEIKEHKKGHILQFIHQSVNDFLLRDGLQFLSKTPNEDVVGLAHHKLSLVCANYIRMTINDNLIISTSTSVKDQFPFMHYAAMSWLSHAEEAELRGMWQLYLLQYNHDCPQLIKYWITFHEVVDQDRYSQRKPIRAANILHIASGANIMSVVQDLLSKDYHLEQVDADGNRALHYASRWGHWKIVKALLEVGAAVDAENASSCTALERAAANGHDEVVRLLLSYGADVNKQIGESGNALCSAAAKGSKAVVQVLLTNQANVNAQGGTFGNALQAAAYRGSLEVVQLLLDNQADVHAQGGHYGNALQAAAYRGSLEVVQLLLDNQADVHAQGAHYGNALQAAASSGYLKLVQLLLDNQADVHAQGGFYGNALQAAASSGNLKLVQLLLDNQADVHAQGGYYGNALQAATTGGNHQIIQLLSSFEP